MLVKNVTLHAFEVGELSFERSIWFCAAFDIMRLFGRIVEYGVCSVAGQM